MQKIKNKTLTSREIKKTLQEYAQENQLPLQECDFKLLSVSTAIKEHSNSEFVFIDNNVLKTHLEKRHIINEHIQFMQSYYIELFHQKKCPIKLEYKINFGVFCSHPMLIISPTSHLPYKHYKAKEFLALLFKEINKIKAYHRILINIFDEEMRLKLKSFVKYIYAGKFTKKIQLPLFDGIKPLLTQESKLIFYFQKEQNDTEITEVDKDETLIKYIKPIFGTNGLNAFGKEIAAQSSNNEGDLEAQIDTQSIYIEENEHFKKYKSKRKGYVHFDGRTLSVDNQIKIKKISRNNTLLSDEEENNIEVIVSQTDTTEDSVGEGVTLTSETIHVNGFVGANSKLEATHLLIDGATHQDSKQFAKFAKINRHKGTLRCHNAQITLLEGGEIHASDVHIETCMGGSIYAKNVTINHIKNNLKIYASHSIHIKLISGEDNILHITHKNIPILDATLSFIAQDIDDLKYQLEEATRHNPKKVPQVQKSIDILRQEKQNILESYKEAKVSIDKPLRGLNTIVFTIDEETEFIYKTDAQQYSDFYLEFQENKIILHPVEQTITLQS